MPIVEKVEQEDLILYEILRNPVLCTEFIYNIDLLENEEKFEYTLYQKEFMCDFNSYVSLSCARSVGKTVAIVGIIVWILIVNIFPLEYIIYGVPGKAHLEPVWSNLVRRFRSNSFLKFFLDNRSGINNSEYILKLQNNSQLMCRLAGQTGTGVNFIGLHTPFVMIDETGYFPWSAWTELQPILNTFESGFRMMASGVPTGLRERNVNYHCDRENSNYTKHKISALQNPRFTEEDRLKALELYGGDETDDYIHLVLGLHGKPVFALFDRNNMSISNYPVHKMVLDGTKYFDIITEYISKLAIFPGLPDKDTQCLFGIDLGFTEPTAIVILTLDRNGVFKFHGRITLNKVNYFVQEKLIDYLDTKFKPFIIGIDEGSAGKAVIPRLREHEDFLHKNFKERIVPINFSSQIVLGVDTEGKEIKSKTKPFSVGVLQDYSNNHKIIYSSTDLEMVTELERMTYSKTPTGEIVYKTLTERGGKKGEDHFTSAMLCGALAYYMYSDVLNFKVRTKKLASAFWNVPADSYV